MGSQVRRRRFACGADMVRAWAEVAGDHNPLHLDPAFAATTRFGVPIVHGHLLAAMVANELEDVLGPRLEDGGRVEIRFRAPVPVGSAVWVTVASAGDEPVWASAAVDGTEVLDITVREAS